MEKIIRAETMEQVIIPNINGNSHETSPLEV